MGNAKRNMIFILIIVIGFLFYFIRHNDMNEVESENISLRWIMNGPGKQIDSDRIWKKFNEILKQYLPGIEVDFEIIQAVEYNDRIHLMNAVDEQMDILWTGYTNSFFSDIEENLYMPLNDLYEEYGKDMAKELEPWVIDMGKINDMMYAIPNYQIMATSPIALKTPKKLADKYLDAEKLQECYNNWENDQNARIEFYNILTNYFQNIKNGGELGSGIGVGTVRMFCGNPNIDYTGINSFLIDTDTMKVYNNYETEDYKLWCKNINSWYKMGFVRPDAMTIKDIGTDQGDKGYILWQHLYDSNVEIQETKMRGYDVKVIPLGENFYIKNGIPSTMTAISSKCAHPKEAMQLINLINSQKGKELYNLLIYGFEGEHYEKIGENRIRPFDYVVQGQPDSRYGLPKWAVGNTKNAFEVETSIENLKEYMESVDKSAIVMPTVGFTPDLSAYSEELAKLEAVYDKYVKTLDYGISENWKEIYDEFLYNLKEAGSDTIRDEIQRQLDEWLRNKKSMDE